MILGPGLLLALLLPAFLLVSARAEPRARLLFALIATPFVWAGLFGILRLLAFLTQRDLPAPSFTNPIAWHAGSAAALAVAVLLRLRARLKGLQALLAMAGVIAAALALNYHASVGEEAFRIRPLLGFTEQVHRYDQVRSVRFVTHTRKGGALVHLPRFVVEFADGGRWTSRDGLPPYLPPFFDMEAMELLAKRSNRPIQNVLTVD